MDKFSVCIAGAGVIGLAIAENLSRHPRFTPDSIVVLDQEAQFGQHISSRNSEVIHAGIYYPADSLKAALCVRGKALLYEHCQSYKVDFNKIGKCIISKENDCEKLAAIQERALANGVDDLELWSSATLASEEPAVAASSALYSPSTGILDSHGYMQSLLQLAQSRGVLYAPFTQVSSVQTQNTGFTVETAIENKNGAHRYEFHCEIFINCAGLQAPQLASNIEGLRAASIPDLHLCKGDYFNFTGRNPFTHLIYPLPEDALRGLGIHSTMDLSGQLRFGPDAEYIEQVAYSINPGKAELFVESIAQYFPGIQTQDLVPAYSGIRPKLSGPDEPAADFLIQEQREHGIEGLLQLFGIESPGLTASLAIAEHVAERL